jgi:hypothetical protein
MRFVAFTAGVLATTACNSPPPTSPPTPPTTVATHASGPPIASSAPPAGATVTIVGIARNVKGGAVVVGDDGYATRIDHLDEWPKNLVDRRVIAEGHRVRRNGPECASDPVLPCQGIVGEYWVLTDAKIRLE